MGNAWGNNRGLLPRAFHYGIHYTSNMLEIFSIAASIASIILAIVAIGLAVFFYRDSKSAESNVATSLEGIKTQSEILKEISARWMDRLTEYVTRPGQLLEIAAVAQTIRTTGEGVASSADTITLDKEQQAAVVTLTIALYYYVGMTNVEAQGYLYPQGSNQLDPNTRDILDQSYKDFKFLEGVIGGSKEDPKVKENRLFTWLETTDNNIKPRVKNSPMVQPPQPSKNP